MHAPQPLQAVRSSTGFAMPPISLLKRMARCSQLSSQTRHSTRLNTKQLGTISTLCCQASSSVGRKMGSEQALTHFPQKVHSPLLKSTSGNWLSPITKMLVSHCVIHCWQEVHFSSNTLKSAHGGRIAECPCVLTFSLCRVFKNCPRKKLRRESDCSENVSKCCLK